MSAGVRPERYAFLVKGRDLVPVHCRVYLAGRVLCMMLIFQSPYSLLTLVCRQALEVFDRQLNIVSALVALQRRALPQRRHRALRPERQFRTHSVRHDEDDHRRLILPRDGIGGAGIVTPAIIEGYSHFDLGAWAPVRFPAEIDE